MDTPDSRRRAGEIIETARARARLSKRSVAQQAGISEVWYRAVTTGLRDEQPQQASDEVWLKLARACGVDPEEVFTALGRDLPQQPAPTPVPNGSLDLRDGEDLTWLPRPDGTLVYRMTTADGSGSMMPARPDTPIHEVAAQLRRRIDLVRQLSDGEH
ncbi:helix-turn-helix transcriptional regulator [Lipingzhangella sp. LS1_29]|uniref:Helix-turn-helix transcriptional regulator n=1 Tax=Lipingzhangella rawalii TaxID=2055835 RepID=A0ABU2H311_9ACTN|nr:helix-turn-helix transcriptional regulator [Lipingzhangella rawalii]MDS1269695.1 helix-turn-helix transcriptional regulator [Lipingzhangella rawalii]